MRYKLRPKLVLVSGLAIINILVFGLSAYSLGRSMQEYELRAQTLAMNIASAIDQNISIIVEKIHLSIDGLVDETELQIEKGINNAALSRLFEKYVERMPEIEGFRAINKDGLLFLGNGITHDNKVDMSDREYFLYHKNNDDHNIHISKLLISRVTRHGVIVFSHRYNYPDGSFAGVVYATVAIDYFEKLLSQFHLGPADTIALRDPDLDLVVRYPLLADQDGNRSGTTKASKELRELYDSGAAQGTYYAVVPTDGVRRVLSFRRVEKAPMVVIAGLARDGYLSGWYGELYKTLVIDFVFLCNCPGGSLTQKS